MLETVREFAAEQLAAGGESDLIRDAHAAWCIALGERWWVAMATSDPYGHDSNQIPLLEAEYPNVRAAIDWMDKTGDDAGIARLTGAICWFLSREGHRSEGYRWLERASHPRAGGVIAPAVRMRVLQGVAILARNRGEYDEAIKAAQEVGAIAADIGDRMYQALSAGMLALIAQSQGDYDRSETLCLHAASIMDEIGHQEWKAMSQLTIAQAALGKGELERAAALIEQTLARYQQHEAVGTSFGQALALGYLGLARSEQGRGTEAAAHFAAALPYWLANNNAENLSEWLAEVATVAAAAGEHTQAAHLLGAASALRSSLEHAFSFPERARFEWAELSAREKLGEQAFTAAWERGAATSTELAIADASDLLARMLESSAPLVPAGPLDQFNLTPRERDVLRLLVAGRSDREIAEALFIGARTVETHVSNLIAKLGVHNRTEAAALATREGLV